MWPRLLPTALGQVMLYVDGMNGVMEHSETIQWLYSLLDSQYRLVVKTALKLLLVFVEYTEPNGLLLVKAIGAVDRERGEGEGEGCNWVVGLGIDLGRHVKNLCETIKGCGEKENIVTVKRLKLVFLSLIFQSKN